MRTARTLNAHRENPECSAMGKHRKHPSGRGHSGLADHHRIWVDKYHPGYFGKIGMRYFHKGHAGKFFCPTINVEKLHTLVSEEVSFTERGAN